MTTAPEILQERLRRQLERRELNRLLGDGGLRGRSGLVAPRIQGRKRGLVNELPIAMPEPLTVGGQVVGSGQLLLVAATGVSIESGGDHVAFDTVVYQHGFADVGVPGESVVWPADFDGSIQIEFEWDSYEGGGTTEIEVDGVVPAFGTVHEGSSGQYAVPKRRGVRINAGSSVKIKVTQSSGSAQTANVFVEFLLADPSSTPYSTYAATVLADGPLAYWRLDETSGTTAVDATSNGFNATYVGTYTLGAAGVMQDGSENGSLNASGSTGSGVTGSDWAEFEFAGADPFSVECWFNADTLASGSRILVQKQVTNSGAGWELVVVGGASAFVAGGRSDGGTSVTSAAGSITTGTSHHAVMTYDGVETMGLFLDGVAVDSEAGHDAPMASNTVALSIGHDSGSAGASTFDGRIDEVAIYARALSAAEVAEHYAIGTRSAA